MFGLATLVATEHSLGQSYIFNFKLLTGHRPQIHQLLRCVVKLVQTKHTQNGHWVIFQILQIHAVDVPMLLT